MAHTPETRARAYAKMKARRREWFNANGPCKCGSWIDLELDHIDPSQKVSHSVWSWREERMSHELSKCQPLCSICHKAKTAEYVRLLTTGRPKFYGRKLTPEQVINIRLEVSSGGVLRKIGARYGVSHVTIIRIARSKHYPEVV